MNQVSRQVTHFSNFRGFAQTACGKSMHGWSMYAPKNVTDKVRDVTCKRCLKKLSE